MTITAIFESWHIGDGNYPPLQRGQQVSLSFEMETSQVTRSADCRPMLSHEGGGQYRFAGDVLRVYNDGGSDAITIIEAAGFRFYINKSFGLRPGDCVQGQGKLVLDHYIWVENLEEYKDAPDLFYQLRISRIRMVRTPERFISRLPGTKSLPASLRPEHYVPEDVLEIETMEGQPFDEEFYLLDLTDEGVAGPVPKTFLS